MFMLPAVHWNVHLVVIATLVPVVGGPPISNVTAVVIVTVALVAAKVGDEYKGIVLAWGISFSLSKVEGGTVQYVVNIIRMREMFGDEELEPEADGDEE